MALKLPDRPVPCPPTLVIAPDNWIDMSEHPAAPLFKEADKIVFAKLKAKKAAGTLTKWEAYDLRECVTGRVIDRRRRRMTRDERYRDMLAVEAARTPRDRELSEARFAYGVKLMARLDEEREEERRDAAHGSRLVFEVEATPPAASDEEEARDAERARFIPDQGGVASRAISPRRRRRPRLTILQAYADGPDDDDDDY
ncbi:hypothetical protein E3T28_09350 [Cryobacterium sinapicolor]|uniref:Uncharacterized protein n=1 Tax=Cryobacterium sinapicolor TaxID=1259236 RepID=A0ABY2J207_9MICO|nr:hypothetical protein [Cryobacterium sinapicolor]TFC98957.1 hypothetical protein E3T28_09350 [Cryobacterium sinapicolor]